MDAQNLGTRVLIGVRELNLCSSSSSSMTLAQRHPWPLACAAATPRTFLSSRPDRISAGSKMSALFVAAITCDTYSKRTTDAL